MENLYYDDFPSNDYNIKIIMTAKEARDTIQNTRKNRDLQLIAKYTQIINERIRHSVDSGKMFYKLENPNRSLFLPYKNIAKIVEDKFIENGYKFIDNYNYFSWEEN